MDQVEMSDRSSALRVLAALNQTPIGSGAVLVGSSGLFGFETRVQALTEDIDVVVPERLVREYSRRIVEDLAALGFFQYPDTATFVEDVGESFDILGHGDPADGDYIGGSDPLRVMVFEDLSRILGVPAATRAVSGGSRSLSAAGFVASKLLTTRSHKGAKDKLQALLVIAERSEDEKLEEDLCCVLARFNKDRIADVGLAAQEAFLVLGRDPSFSDSGAECYAPALGQIEAGFERLLAILGVLDAR